MKKLFIPLLFASIWAAESPRAGSVRNREGQHISQTALRDIKSLEIKDLKSLNIKELKKVAQDPTILKHLINKHGTLMSAAILKWIRSGNIVFDANKLPNSFNISPFVTDTFQIPGRNIVVNSHLSILLSKISLDNPVPDLYRINKDGTLDRMNFYIARNIIKMINSDFDETLHDNYLSCQEALNHIEINDFLLPSNGFPTAIIGDGVNVFLAKIRLATGPDNNPCVFTRDISFFPMASCGILAKCSPNGREIFDSSGLSTWFTDNEESGVYEDCELYKIGNQYSWYIDDEYIGSVEKTDDIQAFDEENIFAKDQMEIFGLVNLSKYPHPHELIILASDITDSGKDILLLTKNHATNSQQLRLLTTGEEPNDEMEVKDFGNQIPQTILDKFKSVKIDCNKKSIAAQYENTGLVVFKLDLNNNIVSSKKYSTGINKINKFFFNRSGEFLLLNCNDNKEKNFISIIKLI